MLSSSNNPPIYSIRDPSMATQNRGCYFFSATISTSDLKVYRTVDGVVDAPDPTPDGLVDWYTAVRTYIQNGVAKELSMVPGSVLNVVSLTRLD